jgi:hypothetical protein
LKQEKRDQKTKDNKRRLAGRSDQKATKKNRRKKGKDDKKNPAPKRHLSGTAGYATRCIARDGSRYPHDDDDDDHHPSPTTPTPPTQPLFAHSMTAGN